MSENGKNDKTPPEEYGDTIGEFIALLLKGGFHGKVEISIHAGEVTLLNLESKIPYDKLSGSKVAFFQL